MDHNYGMNPNPFQFNEHRDQDPDRETTISHTIRLKAVRTKYKQVQQVFLTHHVRLSAKTVYNLMWTSKLFPEKKI